MTVIFPHIPKTGGTSLQEQLKMSGLKVFFDYVAPPGNGLSHQLKEQQLNEKCDQIDFADYDIVFGHFPIKRYSKSHYSYVTLVRDPLERAISHYYYQISRVEKGIRLNDNQLKYSMKLVSGEISFFEFSKQWQFNQLYNRYLDYRDKNEFEIVGTTHEYPMFILKLNDLLGIKLDPAVQIRKREKTTIKIPEQDIEQTRLLLKNESDWYKDFIA